MNFFSFSFGIFIIESRKQGKEKRAKNNLLIFTVRIEVRIRRGVDLKVTSSKFSFDLRLFTALIDVIDQLF